MASRNILLKGGFALIHDAKNRVVPTKTDILVENGKIIRIASEIIPPQETETIDRTDKIVSPGFIDSHRHGWQTQLKGRHANEQLLQYMVTGKISCANQALILMKNKKLTVSSILA
jgi:cytosine/adenosine deaminase-related metal-dependent hydrolase